MNQTEDKTEIEGIDMKSYCHLYVSQKYINFALCGVPRTEDEGHNSSWDLKSSKCPEHPNGLCPKCLDLAKAYI